MPTLFGKKPVPTHHGQPAEQAEDKGGGEAGERGKTVLTSGLSWNVDDGWIGRQSSRLPPMPKRVLQTSPSVFTSVLRNYNRVSEPEIHP